MGGRKLFTNQTPHLLKVTLAIRASEDPRNSAGTREFQLGPGERDWQEYGDSIHIYLNGIAVTALSDQAVIAQQEYVVARGSELDNQLNMFNAIDFSFDGKSILMQTRQTM